MTKYVSEVGRGAVVYVDDFAGSGKQFIKNRNLIAQFIGNNFAEFFLVACLCEEARDRLEEAGVIPVAGLIHLKEDRPLHEISTALLPEQKQRLINLSSQLYPPTGLGFQRMASMVILSRNAPNNVPQLLRGNAGQHPSRGLFPRWDDL